MLLWGLLPVLLPAQGSSFSLPTIKSIQCTQKQSQMLCELQQSGVTPLGITFLRFLAAPQELVENSLKGIGVSL